MTLSEEAQEIGARLATAASADAAALLTSGVGRFLGWPYSVASGRVDPNDDSDAFSLVIYVGSGAEADVSPDAIPADSVALAIEGTAQLDLEGLRAAYARVAAAKRVKKAPAPRLEGTPVTNITLGIIFAQQSALPMEVIAEELERLNTTTAGREWPDMVVVAETGVINYTVQFPGDTLGGDYLPPAEGATEMMTPPWYIVMVARPTGVHTFNHMMSFALVHLGIFSPGAKLPDWTKIREGMPQIALTICGYQYNLKGEIVPVPRAFYNDRYLPPPPLRIESQEGELLATIQFVPWQEGGAILLRGKLPLAMLLAFLGSAAQKQEGVLRPNPEVQLSYVLPITREMFHAMLGRFQARSNMVVRNPEGKSVFQKIADEGSSSPFYARLFMGILRLRDTVYSDAQARDGFDRRFEFVSSSLVTTRDTAREIREAWEEHSRRIASGEIARVQGSMIQVDVNLDARLRKQVETFLNAAVRVLKQGMQDLAKEMQVELGFLFKKQHAFETHIAALLAADPLLADYLRQSRGWTEELIKSRNAVEHEGWRLPRVEYAFDGTHVTATEPRIANQPVTHFVNQMLDRLCCFVEEVTAHCIQRLMPAGMTITETPVEERPDEAPERFQPTLASGGLGQWNLAYHTTRFEET